MNFTQIVYNGAKEIVITNNVSAYTSAHAGAGEYKVYSGLNSTNLIAAIDTLNNTITPGALIEEAAEDAIQTKVADKFDIIHAGGGLVYNDEGCVLMIFRRGKWDLPKGKLDPGETIEQCAVRELEEETGIEMLTIVNKITETWHIYNLKGKTVLKCTTWFKMTSTDKKTLIPQAIEDILEVHWVAPKDLAPYLGNTYQAIKDVFTKEGLA